MNNKFFPKPGEECLFRSEGYTWAKDFVWCKYHGKLINNEGLIIELVKTSPPLTCVDSFDPKRTEFKAKPEG